MENYLAIYIGSLVGGIIGIVIGNIIYEKEILQGLKCFLNLFLKLVDFIFLNNFFKKKREAEERESKKKKEAERKEYEKYLRKGMAEGKSFTGFDKIMATLIKLKDEVKRKKKKDNNI